jgi:hypothetical protein
MITAAMPRPLTTAIDAGSGTMVAETATAFTGSWITPLLVPLYRYPKASPSKELVRKVPPDAVPVCVKSGDPVAVTPLKRLDAIVNSLALDSEMV